MQDFIVYLTPVLLLEGPTPLTSIGHSSLLCQSFGQTAHSIQLEIEHFSLPIESGVRGLK